MSTLVIQKLCYNHRLEYHTALIIRDRYYIVTYMFICVIYILRIIIHVLTSLVAQTVKCLPTMWETQVRSLGREDPLEKGMATHSSTLAWKIPWEEPGRLQSMGSQRVGYD